MGSCKGPSIHEAVFAHRFQLMLPIRQVMCMGLLSDHTPTVKMATNGSARDINLQAPDITSVQSRGCIIIGRQLGEYV